jgi:SAM-dependent methyltransferase
MSDFAFRGYKIPVDLVEMTGGGPGTFEQISSDHIQYLRRQIGLAANHRLLEIGCGCGRDAIPLSEILSPPGSYLGIDIIGRSIEWCRNNIMTRNPHMQFVHYDVADQLHNPAGKTQTSDIILPLENASIDRIILWSVLTHMFEQDIEHYFREFARVLKPDGVVLASIFIVDEDILAAARRVNLTPHNLRFEHLYAPGCYINNPAVPAGAVAYTRERIEKMIAAGRLQLDRPPLIGQWWGNTGGDGYGQDVIILRRQR